MKTSLIFITTLNHKARNILLYLTCAFLLVIIHSCKSTKIEEKIGTVEFLAFDQLSNPLSSMSISVKEATSHTNNQFIFQLPTDTASFPLSAEIDGGQFCGPDSIVVIAGDTLVYALTFFRGYHFAIHTTKIGNQFDTTAYEGVAINLNDNSIGTTDRDGILAYYHYDDRAELLTFTAKAPGTRTKIQKIQFDPMKFAYDVPFDFTIQLIAPKPEVFTYYLVMITKKEVNGNQENIGGIKIYKDGNFIGATNRNGRLANEQFTTDKEGPVQIEAVSDSLGETQRWTATITKTQERYFKVFPFKVVEQTEKPCLWWEYQQNFKPKINPGDKVSYVFRFNHQDTWTRAVPEDILGEFYNKWVDYYKVEKSINVVELDKNGNTVKIKWYFKLVTSDGRIVRPLNPCKSFRENGINARDIISITQKP